MSYLILNKYTSSKAILSVPNASCSLLPEPFSQKPEHCSAAYHTCTWTHPRISTHSPHLGGSVWPVCNLVPRCQTIPLRTNNVLVCRTLVHKLLSQKRRKRTTSRSFILLNWVRQHNTYTRLRWSVFEPISAPICARKLKTTERSYPVIVRYY